MSRRAAEPAAVTLVRSPLEEVAAVADRRRAVETEYRRAIAAAVAAGVSQADVGRAAGITRQGVRYLLERAAAGEGVSDG